MKYEKPIIHKSMYQSSFNDPAKRNHRTSMCQKEILNTEIAGQWKKVTYKQCLRDKK